MSLRGSLAPWLVAACLSFTACDAREVPAESEADGDRGRAGGALTSEEGGVRPFSPGGMTFHEMNATLPSERTYIRVADTAAFAKVYGNFLFGTGDPTIVGLVGEPNFFSPFVPSANLQRLRSSADIASRITEIASEPRASTSRLLPRAEFFLFSGGVDPAQSATELSEVGIDGLTSFRQLAPGCLYARLAGEDEKDSRAAIVLLRLEDRVLSLDDPADKACMDAFFAASMGLTNELSRDLLPPASACDLARVSAPDAGSPSPLRTSNCRPAEVRRAQMLAAYAREHGAGLSGDRAATLLAQVRRSCADLAASQNEIDQSCEVLLLESN